MRRGEAKRLEWIDIDAERNTITLNEPEKRSNPRIWKVTPQLIAQLNALTKVSQKLFGDCRMDSLKSAFLHERKKLSVKLQNPRLLKIGFHTFRHWKATMLYHKTKDPFYVRYFLGHKSMKNTERYVNIERRLFAEYGNDEFTVKTASTPQELTVLLEVGFEYVCQKDNLIFLRKRK
jgi:integrase